jgi:hypothetical protein
MKYQDLKIRDMLRVLALGILFAFGFLVLILNRVRTEPLLNGIDVPRAHHSFYWVTLSVLGTMAAACIVVAAQYLLTSPEQNARYILKAKANLPPSLLETDNPYYGLPTWKYISARFAKQADRG